MKCEVPLALIRWEKSVFSRTSDVSQFLPGSYYIIYHKMPIECEISLLLAQVPQLTNQPVRQQLLVWYPTSSCFPERWDGQHLSARLRFLGRRWSRLASHGDAAGPPLLSLPSARRSASRLPLLLRGVAFPTDFLQRRQLMEEENNN